MTEVCELLGVNLSNGRGICLGMPRFVGRDKKVVIWFLKEKEWTKLAGWNKSLLSIVGKEVLIKSVAQAQPTYWINMFLKSDNICALTLVKC